MISIGKWFRNDENSQNNPDHNFVPKRDFSTRQGSIDAIIDECKKQGLTLNTQIAYVLATVEHETGGTFKPVYEAHYLGKEKAQSYLKKLRYFPYYGRGFVQITWLENYRKYSKKTGIDLVSNPDLAMEPNTAVFILVDGFKNGEFTGKTLGFYINDKKTDFLNARRCINGIDRREHIAKIAEKWLKYLNNSK